MIAQDVLNRIHRDFVQDDISEVIQILVKICKTGVNVGDDQICRSVIYLSDGNLEKIKSKILPLLKSDPRDVVDEAERKAGAPGHYFSIPFPEIDNFFDKLYENMDEEPPPEIWI